MKRQYFSIYIPFILIGLFILTEPSLARSTSQRRSQQTVQAVDLSMPTVWSLWFSFDLFATASYDIQKEAWGFAPKGHVGVSFFGDSVYSYFSLSTGVFGETLNFADWSIGGYVSVTSGRYGLWGNLELGSSSLAPFLASITGGFSLVGVDVRMLVLEKGVQWTFSVQLRIPISTILWGRLRRRKVFQRH